MSVAATALNSLSSESRARGVAEVAVALHLPDPAADDGLRRLLGLLSAGARRRRSSRSRRRAGSPACGPGPRRACCTSCSRPARKPSTRWLYWVWSPRAISWDICDQLLGHVVGGRRRRSRTPSAARPGRRRCSRSRAAAAASPSRPRVVIARSSWTRSGVKVTRIWTPRWPKVATAARSEGARFSRTRLIAASRARMMPVGCREGQVEEEQELPAGRRLHERPGLGSGCLASRVDRQERHERHLLALVLELEVGRRQARDRAAGLVGHEHGHGDDADLGAEDRRLLRRERARGEQGDETDQPGLPAPDPSDSRHAALPCARHHAQGRDAPVKILGKVRVGLDGSTSERIGPGPANDKLMKPIQLLIDQPLLRRLDADPRSSRWAARRCCAGPPPPTCDAPVRDGSPRPTPRPMAGSWPR